MRRPQAISFRSWLLLLLLTVAGLGLAGCATTEADNDNKSSKPWNSPEGWQSGVPSQMLNGR